MSIEENNEANREANKAVARRYIEEFLNQGRTSIAEEIFAPDFVSHRANNQGEAEVGIAARVRANDALRSTYPDWHVTIENLVAEGDFVVDRVTITGSYAGHEPVAAPRGQRFTAQAMHMWRLADGKLAEGWIMTNLPQLGVGTRRASQRETQTS